MLKHTKHLISHIAKGFCMGTADIIPGVSGGTMAFILGIYGRLIDAIAAFDIEALKLAFRLRWHTLIKKLDIYFLLPLAGGLFAALLFFTKIVPLPYYIIHYPSYVYGLFFGLILGSILILLSENRTFNAVHAAWFVCGAAFGWLIVNVVPMQTPTASWFIFLCGFMAISAMLLPGISGSFILLILGKYAYILDALGSLDFRVISAFGLGCVCGLMVFSRVVSWMLHHYRRRTLWVIKGVLVGSLWMIWPFQERIYAVVREKQRLVSSTPIIPETMSQEVVISLMMIVVGLFSVLLVQRLGSQDKSNKAASIS